MELATIFYDHLLPQDFLKNFLLKYTTFFENNRDIEILIQDEIPSENMNYIRIIKPVFGRNYMLWSKSNNKLYFNAIRSKKLIVHNEKDLLDSLNENCDKKQLVYCNQNNYDLIKKSILDKYIEDDCVFVREEGMNFNSNLIVTDKIPCVKIHNVCHIHIYNINNYNQLIELCCHQKKELHIHFYQSEKLYKDLNMYKFLYKKMFDTINGKVYFDEEKYELVIY